MVRGTVYFAHAVGTPFVKIGFTSEPDAYARMPALQTGCPHDLDLVALIEGATMLTEAALHETWSAYRVRGEWFKEEGHLAAWLRRYYDDPSAATEEALHVALLASAT